MESNWMNKVNELGIDENKLSKSIKTAIESYNDAINKIAKLQLKSEETEDEDRKSAYDENIESLAEEAGKLDEKITAKIIKWDATKETRAATIKKMQAARKYNKKKEEAATDNVKTAKEPAKQSAVIKMENNSTAQKEYDAFDKNSVPDEKKRNNTAIWIVVGVASLFGLGVLAKAIAERNQ